jgi:hypothetical protein
MALVWDAFSLAHLIGRSGGRGITPSEVAEVIRSPASTRRRLRGARRAYRGPTRSGRVLVVVVEVQGSNRLRPWTAWEVTG